MAVYAGRDVTIKVDTADAGGAGATWVSIGQQRGGSFSRSTDTADATYKTSGAYTDAVGTRISWTVSCDGVLNPADTAWAYLLTKWAAVGKVWVQVNCLEISGEYKEGQAIITDLSYEFPDNDVVSFTIELQGCGALTTSTVYS